MYTIGHPLMMESVQEMTGVSWRNSSLERWRATKWAPVWSSGAPSVERRPPRRTTCWTTLRESTSPTRSDTTVPTVPRHWRPRTPCQSMCTQPISNSSHSRWPSRTFPGSTASQASPSPLFPCLLFPCPRFPRQNREKMLSKFLCKQFKNIDNLLPDLILKHNLRKSEYFLFEPLTSPIVQGMTGVCWRNTLCET